MMYVAVAEEHLRDGMEQYAKIFFTIEEAIEWINKDRFAYANHTFALFELGKRLPIIQEETEIPQPSKVESRYRLAKDGGNNK